MRRRLASQDGFTVVLAIVVLLVGLLLTTALIAQSVSTSGAVNRDGSSRRAVQAALAGAQLGESTLMATVDTTWNDDACPTPDGATVPKSDPGAWCVPTADPLELGANESVRYAISPQYTIGTQMAHDVVAIGTANGVHRRVRQRVEAYDVRGIFSDYAIVSDADLTLSSNVTIGSPEYHANIRSNGDIDLRSNVTVCGDATPGVAPHTVTFGANAGLCDFGSTVNPDAPIELPSIDPTDVRTNNDDAAICAGGCPSGVTFSGGVLSLGSNASLTVNGNTFLLCSLRMSSNATLTLSPTDLSQPVRVFIDAPSQCGGTTTSIDLQSNTQIRTTSSAYPLVQLLVVGADPPTRVDVASNGSIPVELYAPHSIVDFSSNVDSIGGVVGQSVSFSSNVDLYPVEDPARLDFETSPPQPTPGPFGECSTTATFPADDPGAGC